MTSTPVGDTWLHEGEVLMPILEQVRLSKALADAVLSEYEYGDEDFLPTLIVTGPTYHVKFTQPSKGATAKTYAGLTRVATDRDRNGRMGWMPGA